MLGFCALPCALDTHRCYHFPRRSGVCGFVHYFCGAEGSLSLEGSDVPSPLFHASHQTVAYLDPRSRSHEPCRQLTLPELEALMHVDYTCKLLFESSNLLRNYPFWGYSWGEIKGDTDQTESPWLSTGIPVIDAIIETGSVSSSIEIRHVPSLEGTQDLGLGLYARETLQPGEILGEYTGVVRRNDGVVSETFDAYGMFYPSAHESSICISAKNYGNVMRCINHAESHQANVQLQYYIHTDGFLHVICVVACQVAKDRQLLMDYGRRYWEACPLINCANLTK